VYLDDGTEEMERAFSNLEKAWAAYVSAQDERGMSVEKPIDKGLSHTLREFDAAFHRGRDLRASVIELSEH
jgi:hypothetical protein